MANQEPGINNREVANVAVPALFHCAFLIPAFLLSTSSPLPTLP